MAGAGGGKGQEGGSNTEWTYFIFAALAAGFLWVTWTYAKAVIVWPAYGLNWLETKAIQGFRLVTGGELGRGGHAILNQTSAAFDGRIDPWRDPLLSDLWSIRQAVGMQTRWVFVAAIAALAVMVAFRMKGSGYKRTFSLAGGKNQGLSLAKYASEHWKVASVSAGFDPDGRDKAVEPALTPLEWLRDNDIRFEDSVLDRDACEAAFAAQLGKPWHGVRRADVHIQIVMVLSALHLTRHKASLPTRERVALAFANSADPEGEAAGIVAEYLADEKMVAGIDRICGKHAFSNPAVFAMIDRTRLKGGSFPSNWMLWLRRVDRSLWYTVNDIGRKRFHVEAAGAVNHFFAERVIGHAIHEPHVEQAIDGIEDYMADQGIYSLKLFFAKKEEDF